MEKLDYLIKGLLKESPEYSDIKISEDYDNKRKLLRSLMNVRTPKLIPEEWVRIQDEFLKKETAEKGITNPANLPVIKDEYSCSSIRNSEKISLWQGDITGLASDAIVNAANCKLLGCFIPCHKCIDNAIHSAAGIELRNECFGIMKKQGYDEPAGRAKITSAFNLPSRYVIHTVGPIVTNEVTENHKRELKSCYNECMKIAEEYKLKSIAFCCISTGEFHFPNVSAAEIALDSIDRFLDTARILERVVINVFKEEDYSIYRKLFR